MCIVQIFISPVAANIAVNTCIALGYVGATLTDLAETQEFTPKAHGLLINTGNLSQAAIPAMKKAVGIFNELGKPWVLDPVSIGATSIRRKVCMDLLAYKPAIIRGNAAEIRTLAYTCGLVDTPGKSAGPDSLESALSAQTAAIALACRYNTVIGVSGKTDFVTDGKQHQHIQGGHELITKVTGTGCAVSTMIAGLSTQYGPFAAAVRGFTYAGKASEVAAQRAQGPGTFQMHWIDALYHNHTVYKDIDL